MPIKGHIYLLCLSNRSPILFIVNECFDDYLHNEQICRARAAVLGDSTVVAVGRAFDIWLGNSIYLVVRINRRDQSLERHFAIHYPHFESLTDITNASK